MVFGISAGSMKFVDWPLAPLDTSIIVMPASSNSFFRDGGSARYCSIWFAYGSIPCSPSADTRLIQKAMSCSPPQMELVVPYSMSGFTGSSGTCLTCFTAPHASEGPVRPAAAAKLDVASADFMNSRRGRPRLLSLMSIHILLMPPVLKQKGPPL